MTDFLGLGGKIALVVGGGLGMGEATSMTLARAGCDVALIDLDPERGERVASQVRALGRRALAISADVLDQASAAQSVAQVERELGPLSILATIVGQAAFQRAEDVTPEIWDHDQARNLRYFFFYAQAAARVMIAAGRPGAITAVASVSGVQSAPCHAPYGAAKAGLINLVRSLGVEWATRNIRVNAVSPGAIKTARISGEEWDKRIADSLIPYQRQGVPQDIANAILFLSSDLASYVTGQNLSVDGGFTAQFLLGSPPGL